MPLVNGAKPKFAPKKPKGPAKSTRLIVTDDFDDVEFTDDEADEDTSRGNVGASDCDEGTDAAPSIPTTSRLGASSSNISSTRPSVTSPGQIGGAVSTNQAASSAGGRRASRSRSNSRTTAGSGAGGNSSGSSRGPAMAPMRLGATALGGSAATAFNVNSIEHLNTLGAFNFRTVRSHGDYVSVATARSMRAAPRVIEGSKDVKALELPKKVDTVKKKVLKKRVLPECFGQDEGYDVVRVFIRKQPNGLGIRFKIMDGKLVVKGFRPEWNSTLDVKIDDVVMSVNHLDGHSQPADKILEAMRWREPTFTDEAAALPDIVVTVRLARLTRPLQLVGLCREDALKEQQRLRREREKEREAGDGATSGSDAVTSSGSGSSGDGGGTTRARKGSALRGKRPRSQAKRSKRKVRARADDDEDDDDDDDDDYDGSGSGEVNAVAPAAASSRPRRAVRARRDNVEYE